MLDFGSHEIEPRRIRQFTASNQFDLALDVSNHVVGLVSPVGRFDLDVPDQTLASPEPNPAMVDVELRSRRTER